MVDPRKQLRQGCVRSLEVTLSVCCCQNWLKRTSTRCLLACVSLLLACYSSHTHPVITCHTITQHNQVEGYPDAYNPELMLFMDYRRHHTGLWNGGARLLEQGRCLVFGACCLVPLFCCCLAVVVAVGSSRKHFSA